MTEMVGNAVVAHYKRGNLEAIILDALRAEGKDVDHLTPADLAPVDEIHIGGREATAALFAQLNLRPGMRILDIGSGIGGPARFVAEQFGCTVVGIDLTDEFVDVARSLTRRCGLESLVTFEHGDATRLPFASHSFDGAYMLSVAMNVADKAALFEGVHAVLRTGSSFGIYDVMSGEASLTYPLPWATTEETNPMADINEYRRTLGGAGFRILAERDRTAYAIEFFEKIMARFEQTNERPPLGLHLVLGGDAARKTVNLVRNLKRGACLPCEVIAAA